VPTDHQVTIHPILCMNEGAVLHMKEVHIITNMEWGLMKGNSRVPMALLMEEEVPVYTEIYYVNIHEVNDILWPCVFI